MRRIGCLLTLVVCLAFWALVAFVAINVFAASREAQDPGSAAGFIGPGLRGTPHVGEAAVVAVASRNAGVPTPEQARTEALGAMVGSVLRGTANGGTAPRSAPDDRPGLTGVPLAREVDGGSGCAHPAFGRAMGSASPAWPGRYSSGSGGTPYRQPRHWLVLRGGEASYFDDGPGLYGAVHSYRWGDPTYPAVVCRADDATRCVTVTVRDHMAHPTRAIDLSPEAFEQLAPLSDGVVQVTVEYGGPSPTLPETSTEVEP